jgi:hemolysin III
MNAPNDFGPIYLETNMGQFPVEPWNTYSNLIFLFTFLYWAYRTKLNIKQFTFLSYCLPILFVGYVGGTVYHATRSHSVWLILDFGPIYILSIAISLKYWNVFIKDLKKTLFSIFLPTCLIIYLLRFLPFEKNVRISIGYLFLAATSALPLALYANKNRSINNNNIVYALIFFALAISARVIEKAYPDIVTSIFPMGTHWIWHTLGGVTTHFMIRFVYHDTLKNKC